MEQLPLRYLVSATALVIAAVHHLWPGFKADAFTGTFLLIAVLPWLTPLLKTIKLPGGVELELRGIRDELDQTKGQVQSVAIQARVGAAVLDAGGPQLSVKTEAFEHLVALGKRYEAIRDAMPSGPARTETMTRIVAEMLQEAAQVSNADVPSHLSSSSRGQRLVGAVCALAKPSPSYAEALVQSLVVREETPFGQYWLLRALRRVAEVDRNVFTARHVQELRAFSARQKPGTDREYEVSQLLRDLSETVAGRSS